MIQFAHILTAALALANPADQAHSRYDLQQRIAAQPPLNNSTPSHPHPDHQLDAAPIPSDPMPGEESAAANQGAASIKLPERSDSLDQRRTQSNRLADRSVLGTSTGPLITMGSSLAVCLGLFLLVAWFLRRNAPGGAKTLPAEVVQILGHTPLPGRQQMLLIRCGRRLLLVNVSATGAETLTEIDDPDEVSHLAAAAAASTTGTNTASFRRTFERFSRTPHAPGFIDEPESLLSRTVS